MGIVWTCNSILEIFFRQPSESCKNKIPVERGSGNLGLNVSVDDCTAAADRQPSMYSKVANRAAAASAVRPRRKVSMVHQFTFECLEKALRHCIVPAVALATAPAARSYFVGQAGSSTDPGIQCRHTGRHDLTGSPER